MIKLTKENVDKIFSECEWPFEEWKNLSLSHEEAPDGVQLLILLPFGANVVTFHPDKVKQYEQEIGELLDQVPYLSEKTGVSLPILGRTVEGTNWTEDIYEIQSLYLLGAVTDQLLAVPIGDTVTIGRIPKEKAEVTVAVAEEKEGQYVGKVLYREFGKPKSEN